MKKSLFIILFFYFLVLLQTSFLVHFSLWGYVPNLILISVVLLNIFIPNVKLGVGAALIGGFLLDVFSSNFFGFWILILLGISIFIQYILKKYIQFPFAVHG